MMYNTMDKEMKMISKDKSESSLCTGSKFTRVTGKVSSFMQEHRII